MPFLHPLSFWNISKPPSWKWRLLEQIYKGGQFIYESWRGLKQKVFLGCPVISVGGATLGGAGKTPTVLALGHLLRKSHNHVIILTRGYGGKKKGPLWVNPEYHTPQDVGEEALLMAQFFPVCMARHVWEALHLLNSVKQPHTVVLWDDGHQNPRIHKTLSLLVINERQRFGNEHVFPAGPLRQSLAVTLQRTDAVIYLYVSCPELSHPLLKNQPIFPLKTESFCGLPKGRNVVGFCGLGDPARFEQDLHRLGLCVKEMVVFPDHHFYTPQDEEALLEKSLIHHAQLVTSAKDMIKLSTTFQAKVTVLHQDLSCSNALETYLKDILMPV